MKIIIAGGKGLLATNILPALSLNHDILIADIASGALLWDIGDRVQGEEIITHHKPEAILNFAAITNVDGCEDNAGLATRINGEAPGILAKLCEKHHVKLLHMSTDYVFDGTKESPYQEEDRPNPQSVYGATKLLGETNVMKHNPSSLIVRIEWLYGDGGGNFITKIRKAAENTGAVRVVNDQRGTPTYAKDLAYPLKALVEQGKSGIYHVTNQGSCTWCEFAREIFSQLRMDVEVTPITSAQLNMKARRPANSVFDCSKLRKDTGIALRSWKEALGEYLGAQR